MKKNVLFFIVFLLVLSGCNDTLLGLKRKDNLTDNITEKDNISIPPDVAFDNKSKDNISVDNLTDFTKDPNFGKYRADGDFEEYVIKNPSQAIPELGSYKYLIVLLGDGYLAEDNRVGGAFDNASDKLLTALFNIEPFKTYSGHFKVIKIYANSVVRTTSDRASNEKTVFGSQFGLSTSRLLSPTNTLAVDRYSSVTNFTSSITGRSYDLAVMIVNTTIYGGSGGNIITTSDNYSMPEIAIHEVGHGFGLADEYVDDYINHDYYPLSNLTRYANVDNVSDPTKVKWKHLINIPGHTEPADNHKVGIYEGAYYRRTGVFKPSKGSIMLSLSLANRYFNMPSREGIVKRLFLYAKQPYKVEYFLKYDKLQSK